MMRQNRQDVKDRLRGELDFEVNRRAESEIQGLSRKLNPLDEKVDDLSEHAPDDETSVSSRCDHLRAQALRAPESHIRRALIRPHPIAKENRDAGA